MCFCPHFVDKDRVCTQIHECFCFCEVLSLCEQHNPNRLIDFSCESYTLHISIVWDFFFDRGIKRRFNIPAEPTRGPL